MPKRLAITISGAVSLGSYEAGVLYEVINAIGQHNAGLQPADPARIEIDVLTGASAGGMTAAIAAQKLLFEAGSLGDPYNNAFYQPWVRDISIQGLLALQSSEDPTLSFLSSNLVEAISREQITARYATSHVPPNRLRHPAAASAIRLGLALSNLNGVDYTRPMQPSGAFTYTRHQDQIGTLLDSTLPDTCDTLDLWEILRNACVSCGAFPFAFRTKDLTRHKQEYDPAFLDPGVFSGDTRTFTYTDGGVFQNEPLGMAKNFVDEIDEHRDIESRFYLFVAPGARGSTLNSQFNASNANYLATLRQLLTAIQGQAQFHDWITAESLNDKINLFNDRSIGLKNAFLLKPNQPGFIDFNKLIPASNALLPIFFPPPAEVSSLGETRAGAWHRLQSQFNSDYQQLAAWNPQAADAWIDAILTFETAADLGNKDEMLIYGITASDSELAGADVHAFQGFCDQSYRDHDYDVGRAKARAFIDQINAQNKGIAPINYNDRPAIRKIDDSLNGLTIDRVDQSLRQQLKSRLDETAHDIMAELNIGFIERQVIDTAFIAPQLTKLLKL